MPLAISIVTFSKEPDQNLMFRLTSMGPIDGTSLPLVPLFGLPSPNTDSASRRPPSFSKHMHTTKTYMMPQGNAPYSRAHDNDTLIAIFFAEEIRPSMELIAFIA